MPNWCYNRATFTHDDPEQITRLVNAAKAGKLFNEFYPMPPELLEEAPVGDDYQERSAAIAKRNEEEFGYVSWYDWSIAHWGTTILTSQMMAKLYRLVLIQLGHRLLNGMITLMVSTLKHIIMNLVLVSVVNGPVKMVMTNMKLT